MKYLKPILTSLIKHMTKLVIVESPAKCKKIESYLGPGYKCIASFGHIRELADGLKGIDIKKDRNMNVFVTVFFKIFLY